LDERFPLLPLPERELFELEPRRPFPRLLLLDEPWLRLLELLREDFEPLFCVGISVSFLNVVVDYLLGTDSRSRRS
jgi:hypothetical protein